jgi:hypothetical protein
MTPAPITTASTLAAAHAMVRRAVHQSLVAQKEKKEEFESFYPRLCFFYFPGPGGDRSLLMHSL